MYRASVIFETLFRLILFPLTALTERTKGRTYGQVFSERKTVTHWKSVTHTHKKPLCTDLCKEVTSRMSPCVMLQNARWTKPSPCYCLGSTVLGLFYIPIASFSPFLHIYFFLWMSLLVFCAKVYVLQIKPISIYVWFCSTREIVFLCSSRKLQI